MKNLRRNDIGDLEVGGALTALIVVVILVVIGGFMTTTIIPKGEVGVIDTFGNVNDNELGSGFYFVAPWRHVEKLNIQTQEHEYKTIENTLTKEGLQVTIDASVIYHIVPDKASDQYKTIRGDPFDTLVTPNFMGILRDEVKRWSAEDIYTGKSSEIQSDVQSRLSATLEPRGVVIESVLFRGLVLPKDVTTSIEAKIREKQSVEQMGFTVEKQKMEAQRLIIEAESKSKANDILSKSLTPQVLNLRYIEALEKNQNTMYVLGSGSGQGVILPPPTAKNS